MNNSDIKMNEYLRTSFGSVANLWIWDVQCEKYINVMFYHVPFGEKQMLVKNAC